MGGSDDPSNLIELTPGEHAEAHRLLYEQHGHWQDYVAWQGLAQLDANFDAVGLINFVFLLNFLDFLTLFIFFFSVNLTLNATTNLLKLIRGIFGSFGKGRFSRTKETRDPYSDALARIFSYLYDFIE